MPIPRIHRSKAGCRDAKEVAVGTLGKACFVLDPEATDPEIAGEGLDIGRDVSSKVLQERLFCPLEFH
jgi:hypothetical protein